MKIKCYAQTTSGNRCSRKVDPDVDIYCKQHRRIGIEDALDFQQQFVPDIIVSPVLKIVSPVPSPPQSPERIVVQPVSPEPKVSSPIITTSSPEPKASSPTIAQTEPASSSKVDERIIIQEVPTQGSLDEFHLQPIQLNIEPPAGMTWARVGSISDNSCFFHALLYLITNKDYMDTENKREFVKEYRKILAQRLLDTPMDQVWTAKSDDDIIEIIFRVQEKVHEDNPSNEEQVNSALETLVNAFAMDQLQSYTEVRDALLNMSASQEEDGVVNSIIDMIGYIAGGDVFTLTSDQLTSIEEGIYQEHIRNIGDSEFWMTTNEYDIISTYLNINILTVNERQDFFRYSRCSNYNINNQFVILYNSDGNHWEPVVLLNLDTKQQVLQLQPTNPTTIRILQSIGC